MCCVVCCVLKKEGVFLSRRGGGKREECGLARVSFIGDRTLASAPWWAANTMGSAHNKSESGCLKRKDGELRQRQTFCILAPVGSRPIFTSPTSVSV